MTQETSVAELEALLVRQKAAHSAAGAVSAAVRADRIRRVIEMLVKYRDAFCEAAHADFGNRPRTATLMSDLVGSLGSLKAARKDIARWMKPQPRKGVLPFNLFGARGRVEYQPKGVVGIMGTWNYPIFTLLAPLAYVLAAGNRAILKPSELTPRVAYVLAAGIREFFDPLEVAVVNGGLDLGQAFSAQPFDHLVLTGGTSVARAVMRNAAENLVPLTLELGGKSPVIVGRSADLAMTAERIMIAKGMNSGQVCVNADLVYVPKEHLDGLLALMRKSFAALYPGSYATNPDWITLINERHCQRVDGYVREAEARGARVETFGGPYAGPQQQRLPLRVVVDPPADTAIMQNESFGPALVLLAYDRLDEVITDINARPRPLALYYFGRDAAEERKVLDHTISGGVSINELLMHAALTDAPFGGIGDSGMGHYHGHEGFLEFSHARTIYKAGWWDCRRAFGLLPPLTPKLEKMMERVIKP